MWHSNTFKHILTSKFEISLLHVLVEVTMASNHHIAIYLHATRELFRIRYFIASTARPEKWDR